MLRKGTFTAVGLLLHGGTELKPLLAYLIGTSRNSFRCFSLASISSVWCWAAGLEEKGDGLRGGGRGEAYGASPQALGPVLSLCLPLPPILEALQNHLPRWPAASLLSNLLSTKKKCSK